MNPKTYCIVYLLNIFFFHQGKWAAGRASGQRAFWASVWSSAGEKVRDAAVHRTVSKPTAGTAQGPGMKHWDANPADIALKMCRVHLCAIYSRFFWVRQSNMKAPDFIIPLQTCCRWRSTRACWRTVVWWATLRRCWRRRISPASYRLLNSYTSGRTRGHTGGHRFVTVFKCNDCFY